MSTLSKVLVLLATSGLLLALGFLLIDTTPAPTAEPVLPRESERPTAPTLDAPTPLQASDPGPSVSRSAVESSAVVGRSGVLPMRVPPEAAGRLRVLAVDSLTGEPLDRIRVRASSETRFADRQSDRGSGEVELVLTPDTYSIIVLSQGYEPAERTPVRVARGGTVNLDRVPLRAGSASVLGRVSGDRDPGAGLQVELLGEGRRPCASCSTEVDPASTDSSGPSSAWTRQNPCGICGYAEKSSRVLVTRSGTFTFDHLVSGPYALRLIDEQGRTIGIPRSVELHPEETLVVEMVSARPRVVRVEVIDTDGSSLAAEWARRLAGGVSAEPEEGIELGPEGPEFSSPEFRCRFRAGALCLAQSDFSAPPLLKRPMQRPSPFGGRRLGAAARKEPTTDDRPRKSTDALRPEARVPVIESSTVASAVEADGLARFESVPSLDLVLEMKSGPFTATAPVPASIDVTLVRAKLRRQRSRPDPGETQPVQRPDTFLEFEAVGRR